MNERNGIDIIRSLQKKWSRQMGLTYLIMAFAISIFLSAILVLVLHKSWLFTPFILIISVAFVCILFIKKIDDKDVVLFLNQSFPHLQESTQLMLQPADQLNRLEKLQLRRIEKQLSEQVPFPPIIKEKLKTSCIVLATALLFAMILFIVPTHHNNLYSQKNGLHNTTLATKPEIKLPEVKDIIVKISPPAYTGKRTREGDKFNILTEQKAFINWTITTTYQAKDVQLIFNDKSVLQLKLIDNSGTRWMAYKQIMQPGFYQVSIDKKRSELYQIEVIPDEPPVITIQSPKQNTFIKLGESQKLNIAVSLSDDYGIDSTFIHATTASGSGEAVKFKDLRFPFPNFRSGNQKYSLQKMIDLPSIGMTPGDELYFYVTATDNNKQQKRSDVFVVRLEDTAQLFSMTGMVNGLDVKPELFRSERQIIIETEQLLKDKDTISEDKFKKKSSDLGTDQELLRLRYGKYLGEETETEIGEQKGTENNDAADFGNKDKAIDQFSHKHDIAEDADFFDAPTKKQLQAMLTEMWKASLQLKTYKPKEALPFAYNALRLLKDLQQKTRAYVAKAGFQTTPLNPAKRLTGELDKISQPVIQQNIQQKESPVQTLRKAIAVLEKVKSNEVLQKSDMDILEAAGTQLSEQAASNPATYLQAYEAITRIKNKRIKVGDINIAGSAFQKLIQGIISTPQQAKSAPDNGLSKRYFMNLNTRNDPVE